MSTNLPSQRTAKKTLRCFEVGEGKMAESKYAQIFGIFRQAKHGHHFRGGRDIEACFAR